MEAEGPSRGSRLARTLRASWATTGPVRRSVALTLGAAALVVVPVLNGWRYAVGLVASLVCGFVAAYGIEATFYRRLTGTPRSLPVDHSNERREPKSGPVTVGVAGDYATHLAELARERAETPWEPSPLTLFGAGMVLVLPAAFGGPRFYLYQILCALAGATIGFLDIDRVLTGRLSLRQVAASDRAKAIKGAKAERRVGTTLETNESLFAVAHGQMVGGGGDIDHVVLGPSLAVVETKAGWGHLVILDDGTLQVDDHPIHGDPIKQVRRQAAALSDLLDHEVVAIVCVPAASNTPRNRDGVVVCNQSQLPGLLSRLPAIYDRDGALVALDRVIDANTTTRRRRAERVAYSRSPLERLRRRLMG